MLLGIFRQLRIQYQSKENDGLGEVGYLLTTITLYLLYFCGDQQCFLKRCGRSLFEETTNVFKTFVVGAFCHSVRVFHTASPKEFRVQFFP